MSFLAGLGRATPVVYVLARHEARIGLDPLRVVSVPFIMTEFLSGIRHRRIVSPIIGKCAVEVFFNFAEAHLCVVNDCIVLMDSRQADG